MGFFDDEEDVAYTESNTDYFNSSLYKRENDWLDNLLEGVFYPIVIFIFFVLPALFALAFGG